MEKTFASMLPVEDDFDGRKRKEEESMGSLDSGAEDEKSHSSSASEEDGESKAPGEILEIRSSASESVSRNRKLSKSESFSHNSEFDFVQMKRKKFAASQLSSKSNDKRGSSTTDLRSSLSSNHSNSDEDFPQKKIQTGLHKKEGDTINTEHKSTSMHNLAADPQIRTKSNSQLNSNNIHKTTSLMEIQNLDSAVAASSNNQEDLMKTFHSQLEAQFEQWKQDFLKTHVNPTAEINTEDRTESPIHQVTINNLS